MRKPSQTRSRPRASAAIPKAAEAYHHGDLRQALLDAAWGQVDKEGADSLSLAQLARVLRVSQPAPYRHFPDRNALLAAVALRGFREFTERLRVAEAAGPSSGLKRMCHAYVAFGTERPGIYRLMFASPVLAQPGADPELAPVARGSFELLVNAIEGRAGARRQLKALRIWVALHGLVMLANQGLMKGVGAADMPALIDEILAG